MESFQKRFTFCFNDDLRQQWHQCAIFDDAQPAFLVRALLGVGQRCDGVLPGPGGDAVVGACEICLCDLEIQHRLAVRVVFGFDDLPGGVFAVGAQTGALAGVVVHAVEAAAANATTNQTVTCFHTILHATARINMAEPEVLADSRKITPDYAGYLRIGKLVSVLVSVADSLPPNPMLHTQLELEARVGIELYFRPRLTNASSQQTVGSSVFPSVYRLNAAFKTILQNSSTIPPLSPHYSSTIILLEVLLEVPGRKHRREYGKHNGSNLAKGSGKSTISRGYGVFATHRCG